MGRVFIPKPGAFRTAEWYRQRKLGPLVCAFRNIETGQVLFTQTLHPQEWYIKDQFRWPNWQNRLPNLRKDLWRPMAVAQLPSHEDAVMFYQDLVELRKRRDRTEKQQAMAWRKKSADGNIWYYSQFRPVYTQEAVADLASAAASSGVDCVFHWEDAWRKGDETNWQDVPNVQHKVLPRYNPREQYVLLRRLSDSAFADFNAAEQAATESGQLPRSKVAADILAQAGVKLKQRMVEALYADFVPPHVISKAISEHTEFQGLLSRRDKLSKELSETKEKRLAVKENTKNHAKRQDARMAVKKISAALRKIDRHIGELKRDIKLQVAQDVRSGVIAVDKSEIIARRMKQPLKMKANSTKLQKKLRPKKRSARRAAARATSASKPGPSASP
jgi:hypothetical protein